MNLDAAASRDIAIPPDLAPPALFRLPSGVYRVVGPATVGSDQCMIDPNNASNPVAGQIWAIVNDGVGGIKLGNPTDPANPSNPQQYDSNESGYPGQPALGASCPGVNNPAQCTTEPGAIPFNNNQVTLVRDNGVVTEGGQCTLHRHVVNQVTLTDDGKFTAAYRRSDTNHSGCTTIAIDCTSTWTWQFEFVKSFGP